MPRVVKCGLIQASHACSTDAPLETIREANIEKHLEFLDEAADTADEDVRRREDVVIGERHAVHFDAGYTPVSIDPIPGHNVVHAGGVSRRVGIWVQRDRLRGERRLGRVQRRGRDEQEGEGKGVAKSYELLIAPG